MLGEPLHELCGREPDQVMFLGEECVLAFRSLSDLWAGIVAIGNGGGCGVAGRVVDHVGTVFGHPVGRADAFVACPVIDILQDRPVNGFHVGVVEVAEDWDSCEPNETDFHGGFFARSKNYRIGFVELVA